MTGCVAVLQVGGQGFSVSPYPQPRPEDGAEVQEHQLPQDVAQGHATHLRHAIHLQMHFREVTALHQHLEKLVKRSRRIAIYLFFY